MADGRRLQAKAGPGEAKAPRGLTAKKFEALPEFAEFKRVMRGILSVSKAEIDRRVKASQEASPRKNNPNAPGQKAKRRRRKSS